MTTTTSPTHAAPTAHTPSPSPKKGWFREGNRAQYVPLVICMVIALAVTMIALVATGLPGDAYTYDTSMQIIVSLYNVAVMIPVAIFLIRNRKRQKFWLHALVRGGIAIGSIIFTVGLFSIYLNFNGAVAEALWKIPFWGSIVLPFAALVLHAAVAFVLTAYPKDDKKLQKDKANLPSLKTNVTSAKQEHEDAVNEHTARETALKEEQPEELPGHPVVTVRLDGEPTYTELAKRQKEAAEAVTEAQKRYEESDEFKALEEINKEKTKNASERANISEEIKQVRQTLTNATDPQRKQRLKERKDELQVDLDALLEAQEDIDDRHVAATAALEASDAKRELDEAKNQSKAASEAEATRRKHVDELQKDLDAAARELGAKGTKLKEAKAKYKAAKKRIELSNQTFWDNIRDFGVRPVVVVLLLIAAFTLYLSWFGWVRVAFTG